MNMKNTNIIDKYLELAAVFDNVGGDLHEDMVDVAGDVGIHVYYSAVDELREERAEPLIVLITKSMPTISII